MKWTAWTTLAALLVYLWTAKNVGAARGRFKIKAPVMDGPLEFLSVVRVQMNTLEQMVLFLPALWMCAFYLGDRWAAAGGVVWIVGRIVYALAYYKDPSKRGVGFVLSMIGSLGLMIGAAFGLLTF